VGESGCGKTVSCLSMMRLIPIPPGEIAGGTAKFNGEDLLQMTEPQLRKIRGNDVAMIFQEPMTSLNPVFTCGDQVMEAVILHQQVDKAEARRRALDIFMKVGIPDPDRRLDEYPHQLSGGQNQRVVLARVLASNPEFIVADEPLSALDVSVQAQIFGLLSEMKRDRNITFLFISHDLNIVRLMSDRVAVMDRGKIVEVGPTEEIFRHPLHPRTRELVSSASMDGQLTLMLKEGLISTVTRRPRPRMGGVCDDNPMDSKSSRLMINAGCR